MSFTRIWLNFYLHPRRAMNSLAERAARDPGTHPVLAAGDGVYKYIINGWVRLGFECSQLATPRLVEVVYPTTGRLCPLYGV